VVESIDLSLFVVLLNYKINDGVYDDKIYPLEEIANVIALRSGAPISSVSPSENILNGSSLYTYIINEL